MAKYIDITLSDVGDAVELTERLEATGFDARLFSGLVGKPTVTVRKPWTTRMSTHIERTSAAISSWLDEIGSAARVAGDGDRLRIESVPTRTRHAQDRAYASAGA